MKWKPGQTSQDIEDRRGVGGVNPETFTHGSSEQRARWFMRGFKSGRFEDCNTLR